MSGPTFKPGNGKYRIMAEINMIPFIDVSLVLLIIFMIMTPFLVRSQLKLILPKSRSAEEDVQRHQPLKVQVDKQGMAYLDGRPVAADMLEGRLRQAMVDVKKQPLVIEADKDVAFQYVVAVMDAAKAIGASKLAVSVKKTGDAAHSR